MKFIESVLVSLELDKGITLNRAAFMRSRFPWRL